MISLTTGSPDLATRQRVDAQPCRDGGDVAQDGVAVAEVGALEEDAHAAAGWSMRSRPHGSNSPG
jgi:hypothetical protein